MQQKTKKTKKFSICLRIGKQYRNINGLVLIKNHFRYFVSRSSMQIRATCRVYSKISHYDWLKLVDKQFGNQSDCKTIIEFARNKEVYFCKLVVTDEKLLMRVLISRAELDLDDIATKFAEFNGKSSKKWIKDKLSVDFERLMLCIAGHQ